MTSLNADTPLNVALGDRSYDIHIASGCVSAVGKALAGASRVILVTDDRVGPLYENVIATLLDDAGIPHLTLRVPAGEGAKSFARYQDICERALSAGIDRKAAIMALGGGVVGDLAGFAAATLLRGVRFVQVPTTLLAMVDSSVGGKTGINSAAGKNLLGAFYQPSAVVIDTDFLATLPPREMAAGFAEIIKYGVIRDPEFLKFLEDNRDALDARDPAALAHVIRRSCAIKADIVSRDEREETSLRALLNFGHTYAHALEAAAGYDGRLLHGEAVAIGTVFALKLSQKRRLITADAVERIEKLLAAFGLPVKKPAWLNLSADAALDLMRKDKKAESGRLAFVLCRAFGNCYVESDVPKTEVRALL